MNRTRSLVYLLEYGADPHIPDNEGYTPLLEAVLGNHHGIPKSCSSEISFVLLLKREEIGLYCT
jgi:ankyrin repeat protein